MSKHNYGVFDLETFIDTDERGNSYSRVYALGFVTNASDSALSRFFAENGELRQKESIAPLPLRQVDGVGAGVLESVTTDYFTDHFPNTLEGSAKLV